MVAGSVKILIIISQGWMEAQIKKDERAKMLKTRMLRKAKLTTNAKPCPKLTS